MEAPLENAITLCGTMFGLKTYRHRLFESNFNFTVPEHPEHKNTNAKMGRPPKKDEFIQVVGHFSGVKFAPRRYGYKLAGSKRISSSNTTLHILSI